MLVASCRVTLHLSEAHSLKDKRQVLRGLIAKLRDRHNCSVVELDPRDQWQRAELAVALAARDMKDAEARLDRVRRDVTEITALKHIDFETQFY